MELLNLSQLFQLQNSNSGSIWVLYSQGVKAPTTHRLSSLLLKEKGLDKALRNIHVSKEQEFARILSVMHPCTSWTGRRSQNGVVKWTSAIWLVNIFTAILDLLSHLFFWYMLAIDELCHQSMQVLNDFDSRVG